MYNRMWLQVDRQPAGDRWLTGVNEIKFDFSSL
jgi:hypothetical protein